MTVILTSAGDASRIEVKAERYVMQKEGSLFCVVVPQFDDWYQTTNYDLRQVGATVTATDPDLIIEFPDCDARSRFQEWLTEANARARHGYGTMWP